jgi:hypothetical protein
MSNLLELPEDLPILILSLGVIEKVFYPVFPATDNARHVLTYLQAQV